MPQSYTFSASEYALELVPEEEQEAAMNFLPGGGRALVPSSLGRSSALPVLAPIGGSDESDDSGSEGSDGDD
jgi:hypothetical protein